MVGKLMHFTPNALTPPHKVTRPEQVDLLAMDIETHGWQGPPLVGYRLDGGVQLLSGTHRHAACKRLQFAIPVVLREFEAVKTAWGDVERWKRLMEPTNETV